MAGFCTRCGQPLPESGICPHCAAQAAAAQPQAAPQAQPQYQQPQYQQPQYQAQPQYQQPQYQAQPQPQQAPPAPKEPSAFALAFRNFMQFLGGYVKDPVSACRKVAKNQDLMVGLFNIVLTITAAFLTLLVHDLCFGRGFHAGTWLLNSFITPVLAYGIGLGGIFLIALPEKKKIDFKTAVGAVGAAGLLPTVIILAGFLLNFLGLIPGLSFIPRYLYILMLLSAGLCYFLTLAKVLDMRFNLGQVLITLGILVLSFAVVDSLMTWLFSAVYADVFFF